MPDERAQAGLPQHLDKGKEYGNTPSLSESDRKRSQSFKHKTELMTKELVPYLSRIETEAFVEETYKSADRRNESLTSRILHAAGFEYMMGIVIISNMIVMIVETDLSASQEESLSGTDHWTQIFGWMALLIFVAELVLRIHLHRCDFWFADPWNVFDFIVVVTDVAFSIVGLIAGDTFPISVLRIFRLAKLARVSKVLRVFPELRLLLAGLMKSMSSIFWGTLLLLFCLLVWSMIAVLFIHPLNKTIVYDDCERCPRAYSSVMQASLTFWQQIVTGDSWGQASIPLIETYPITLLFFIPLFLSVGMAVTNLILGVVVSVAQQAKYDLEQEDFAERALAKLKAQTQLLMICKQMDSDHSGTLTHEEIYACFETPGPFRDIISALGVTKDDFDIIWTILNTDEEGAVSYKELVNDLCTLRSSDTQFMLAYVKYYITQIKNAILQHITEIRSIHKGSNEVVEGVESLNQISPNETIFDEEVPADTAKELGGAHERGEDNKESGNLEMRQVPVQACAKDAASRAVMMAIHDEAWFKDVCYDIDMLRIQLKDMLMNINCKLGPQFSSTSAADLGGVSTRDEPLLPAMPVEQPSCGFLHLPTFWPISSNSGSQSAEEKGAKNTKVSLQLDSLVEQGTTNTKATIDLPDAAMSGQEGAPSFVREQI